MHLQKILQLFFCMAALALLVLAGAELRSRVHDERAAAAVQAAVSAVQGQEAAPGSGEILPDWQSLTDRWPQLFAWLSWPGYAEQPVMRGSDNSFYLSHAADGARSRAGTPFLDYRLAAADPVWLVYGHNMKSREAFSLLPQLAEKELAQTAPPLTLFTQSGQLEFTLFAAVLVDEADPKAWDYGMAAADRADFLSGAQSRASWWLTSPPPRAQLLALSTCCDFGQNGRLVLLLQAA